MSARGDHLVGVEDKVFDFRSDTVTYPDKGMLEAICKAYVGDDVKGEDTTANKLEQKVAKLCGKESALFVCTGTMSNQIAYKTHVIMNYGRETVAQHIICDRRCHIYLHELGGISGSAGVTMLPLLPPEGSKHLTAEVIEKSVQTLNDLHHAFTTMILLENTLNGDVFPIEELKKVRKVADKYNLILHLDGARLWNASIATGIPMDEYAKYFDSVSLCLSKGLGAPIGSVLVGNREFINRARQFRKMFGGGWRQAGVLAACGLYAIEHNWSKMKQVHENAKVLHRELVKLGFEGAEPETNILFLNTRKLGVSFSEVVSKMNKMQTGPARCLLDADVYGSRLVLHHQITPEGVKLLISLLSKALSEVSKQSKL